MNSSRDKQKQHNGIIGNYDAAEHNKHLNSYKIKQNIEVDHKDCFNILIQTRLSVLVNIFNIKNHSRKNSNVNTKYKLKAAITVILNLITKSNTSIIKEI